MNSQPPAWLAVHLYADEPWEGLLGQGIQPIAQEVISAGLSTHFFFCRSWTRRPHLKLYFGSGPEQRCVALQPRLEHYFRHDFAHRLLFHEPSDRFTYTLDFLPVTMPPILLASAGAPQALAIRYAGLLSQVLLDLFAQTAPWSDARGLTAAMQLHVGLAWSLGLDWAATSIFYRAAGALWRGDHGPAGAERNRRQVSRFAGHLRSQQHKLHSYGRALWYALQLAAPFDEPWFRQWLHALPPMRQEIQPLPPAPTCDPQQWAVPAAYAHLINNQLGIVAQEEVLLSQLLAAVFTLPRPSSAPSPLV